MKGRKDKKRRNMNTNKTNKHSIKREKGIKIGEERYIRIWI